MLKFSFAKRYPKHTGVLVLFVVLFVGGFASVFALADSTTGTVSTISDVQVKNIAPTSAEIHWNTAVAGNAYVLYGEGTAGTLTLAGTSPCADGGTSNALERCIFLSGLKAASYYRFQIKSLSSEGTAQLSAEYNFTTSPSPTANTTPPSTTDSGSGTSTGTTATSPPPPTSTTTVPPATSTSGGSGSGTTSNNTTTPPPPPPVVAVLTVPTNLKASLNSDNNSVALDWTNTSTAAGSIKIWRKPAGGSDADWILVATASGSAHNYTDSNVAAGSYLYDVSACSDAGCSAYSNTAAVIIPQSQGAVMVTVSGPDGSVLSGAAVVLDQLSCSNVTPSSGISTAATSQSQTSDSAGQAKFYAAIGTYCVRAFLPPEQNFINPQGQSVTVKASQVSPVRLAFGKSDTTSTGKATGTVTQNDNTPVADAYVSASSSEGGFARTKSDANGAFTLSLVKNQHWQVQAQKEDATTAWQSSSVPVADFSVPVVLILVPFKNLSKPAEVNQNSSQSIAVNTSDGAGVTVPAGALATTGNINLKVDPTIELPSLPDKQIVGGKGYDITATTDSGQHVSAFNTGQSADIVIPYTDNDFKALGISPEQGIPSFFDEATATWTPLTNFTIDKQRKVFLVKVSHFTKFAIVAPADATPPPVPTGLFAHASKATEVSVRWTDPGFDFHHARVYRSESFGTNGSVLASVITAGSFKDPGVSVGKTYYYRVSAVDPAGNESALTAPASVVIDGKPHTVPSGAHGVGSNVNMNGTIYHISPDGTRRPYTSAGAFLSYGFNSFSNVTVANEIDGSLPEGGFIPPQDGKIICSDRGSDKNTCYLITNGKKSAFVSASVFKSLGFSFTRASFGDVSWMDDAGNIENPDQPHKNGVLINNNGTVQLVTATGLFGFPTGAVFMSWGYSFSDVVPANNADKNLTQSGVVSVRSPGELSANF